MAKKAKSGISEEIKNVLAGARRRQGLTQEQAGKLLGKTQEMVSAKERRPLNMKVSELLLMAQAYGVDVCIGDLHIGGGR